MGGRSKAEASYPVRNLLGFSTIDVAAIRTMVVDYLTTLF